ncbi:hypothetical protein EIP91_010259 [Steccherinum ochraceum]|uniref:Uncharacterized protein n=1 Tax=Steccherinum ochraceum TaxID=92696 RepID=A0A4R0R9Y5_9APHY|nr:hypothetical protein EIP91_010259 [Steccherinum ochraceum]
MADLQALPFPEAEAPWHCKGEAFWFFGHNSASMQLSAAHYGDLERESSFSDPAVSGKFQGGLCSAMFVRYTESPVGPYDELIWVPGKFDVPVGGPVASRITRIYVSTKESIYNGRRNWNIAKAQAHFDFTPNPKAKKNGLPYSKISVASPSDPEHPFFVAEITPSMTTSTSLPFSTLYVPLSMYMAHPPLPQSPNWRETGQVGTDSWLALTPVMKGKAGVFWAQGGLESRRYGDDVGFPDIKLWSLGMWLKDFELEFGISKLLPNATQKDEKKQ